MKKLTIFYTIPQVYNTNIITVGEIKYRIYSVRHDKQTAIAF